MAFLRTAGQVKDALAGGIGRVTMRTRLRRVDLDDVVEARIACERLPSIDPPFSRLITAVDQFLQAVDPLVGDVVARPIPEDIVDAMRADFMLYCQTRRSGGDQRADDLTVLANEPRSGAS